MPAKLENSAGGHRTGKGQVSFQSKGKAMLNNFQTIVQLHLFHILARSCSKSFKLGFNSMWTKNFQMYTMDLEKPEEPEIKLLTFIGSKKRAREFHKNISFCFIHYTKVFDCVNHKTVGNSSTDGKTRSPYLPPVKPVCKSRRNS